MRPQVSLRLVGLLVHQGKQLVHIDAVDHAGLLHGLAAGRGAAQAVHPDGQEDGRGLGRNVKNVTNDGVFGNVYHGDSSISELIKDSILSFFHKFNRESEKIAKFIYISPI